MPNIETSWWKYTGDHVPSDHPGIQSAEMVNLATGELLPSHKLPVGALWALQNDAGHYPVGADGLAIACRLPGNHTWYIDGRASNCTKPQDDGHRCWVRHGTVGDKLTVDKVGLSCDAGAGSIVVPGYHGFLRNGKLVDA